MNQFKKAKQLRNETGQATESITDLKTAGVSQKPESPEAPMADEGTVSQDTAGTSHAIDTRDSVPEASAQPLAANTTNTPPKETEATIPKPAETVVPNGSVIQPVAEDVQIPVPSYENMAVTVVPARASEIIDHNSMDLTPRTTNVPIVSEPTQPIYTAPAAYENASPQPVAAELSPEPQPAQEIAAVRHNKSTKKSVPNIFAPKGEAKSMRKSLVLKPTSVRIAENYCEKNGGSFNELIQTLLDNFIDEYGL